MRAWFRNAWLRWDSSRATDATRNATWGTRTSIGNVASKESEEHVPRYPGLPARCRLLGTAVTGPAWMGRGLRLPAPPDPAHAAELAQRAVDAAQNVSGVELDSSPASLSLVDGVLEEFRDPGSDAVAETIRVRVLRRGGARPERRLRKGVHATGSRPLHVSGHHLSRVHRGACEPDREGVQACRQRRHRQRRLLLQRVLSADIETEHRGV